MNKYNIIKKTKDNMELLEVVTAENIIEAQKYAVRKYMKIVLSTQTQLVVKAA